MRPDASSTKAGRNRQSTLRFARLFSRLVSKRCATWPIAQGEVGATYMLTTAVQFGADYMSMKGNGYLNNNHAHRISASIDYFRSKRTMVYTQAVNQRANAGAQALISGILAPNGTSSGPSQFLTRVGIETRFQAFDASFPPVVARLSPDSRAIIGVTGPQCPRGPVTPPTSPSPR
ncbi:porin [Paraburkholderia dinghuensis]|uniref:Porin n=1 Tax=Paraburkholderia dinghuensis TaxID=2305225 RepID=A0A3N6MR26_9BURK|nr:porin [Paraburkholderia dinghuensis]RQH04245.1 porin [Paraburkholderia dinghuensis]